MTDIEMRIAIAEACGAKVVGHMENGAVVTDWPDGWRMFGLEAGFPDYPKDLNACAQFEKDAPLDYWRILEEIVDADNGCVVAFAVGKATARQRCLALLKLNGGNHK